jgi:diguanylate cyclase (GGDEF)-like protein
MPLFDFMRHSRFLSFIMRHRIAVRDLSLIVLTALVALYWAYAVDVFSNEAGFSEKRATIELDEALLIGALLALALLIFAAKQYFRQRRETNRRIAAEKHVRELAYQDGLTGLPNRRQFNEALAEALGSPPSAGSVHGLFMLDLNGFKQINDVYGHGVGDEALIIVAQRFLAAMREGDMVARLGGDEFAVLSKHLTGAEAATNIALRIIESLETPIAAGGSLHPIGCGIGIALLPDDADTMDEALRKADVALYRAKAERRSTLRFFEPAMDSKLRERAELEQDLRAAFASGEITPVFLPVVHFSTNDVVGFELKPEWRRPDHTVVPEARFIPICEEIGLIHALAENLLRKGCTAALDWPSDVKLSMDVYPSQLKDHLFAARVARLLKEVGLQPQRLQLEITESALVADPDSAGTLLNALHDIGVSVILDNFGTGYSSLYHLRNFKPDAVKIDRRFIEAINTDGESASIVKALVGLGHGLGMSVIAEGVIATEHEISLTGTGCDTGQGPLFSEPLSVTAAGALLQSKRQFKQHG